jgi:hypothetical protein
LKLEELLQERIKNLNNFKKKRSNYFKKSKNATLGKRIETQIGATPKIKN